VELMTSSGITGAFFEVDLGHERLGIWKDKISKYLRLAIASDFESLSGQKQYRVLVIVNSQRMRHSIRKVVRASAQKTFSSCASPEFHAH
jgi:hypothetical protein